MGKAPPPSSFGLLAVSVSLEDWVLASLWPLAGGALQAWRPPTAPHNMAPLQPALNTAICFFKASRRVSLLRWNLPECNITMGVTAYHLCLIKATSQILPTLKERAHTGHKPQGITLVCVCHNVLLLIFSSYPRVYNISSNSQVYYNSLLF